MLRTETSLRRLLSVNTQGRRAAAGAGRTLGLLGLALVSALTGSADAQTAPAPGTGPYAGPGPHEVVQADNVGVGFETTGVDDTEICKLMLPFLTSGQGTRAELNAFAQFPKTLRPTLHALFRPKTLEAGKQYPVVVWGNGTCASPISYTSLLTRLASYGFIVIAPNSRMVGDGSALRLALDYLERENATASSPLYGKVDLTRIGAAGHSSGGDAAIWAATDDTRIRTLFPILTLGSVTKPMPTFYLAGSADALYPPEYVHDAYAASPGPVWYGLLQGLDHIMPATEPERIEPVTIAWFLAQLVDDPAAKAWFEGSDCKLCRDPAWTIERK